MIRVIRGQQVIIDRDLALLYGVETRALNQAVKRNIERFPDDFMFQLDKEDVEILKSQNVTSSWGGDRRLPYAFTEQGIAMLSSVLKSQTAVEVNIRRLANARIVLSFFLKYIFLNIQNNEKPCNFVPGKWESNR